MYQKYFSNIEDFLSTDTCISVRWISNNLDVSISTAGNIVFAFAESHKGLELKYLISGVDKNGTRALKVISSNELTNVDKLFQSVASKTIYAIQTKASDGSQLQLASQDTDQVLDFLTMKHAKHKEFLNNQLGRIKLSGLTIKAAGERVHVIEEGASSRAESSSSRAVVTGVKKETASDHIARAFSNKTAPPVVLKSKSSINASSFFTKSATAPAKSTAATVADTAVSKNTSSSRAADKKSSSSTMEVTAVTQSSSTSQAKPHDKPAASTAAEESEGEDAEWDDGSGYKVDKSRLTARTAVDKTCSSAGDDEVIDVDGDDDDSTAGLTAEDTKTSKKRKANSSKQQAHVHGAMDDYMEGVAVAEYTASGGDGGGGEGAKPKRTKKKLVEKVSTQSHIST